MNAAANDDLNGSEIAIIGMACRFPGARDTEMFWQNLRDGVESITFLTDDQIEPSGIDPAVLDDPNYVRAASILDDIDRFDAPFFGFAPQEAAIMDPQQRLFLECAWEALENAGYNPETYPGAIGVYAGARTNTYLFNLSSNPDLLATLGSFQIGLGNDLAFLTTRVSYKLNLRGPGCSVHTACSTSLVAVHLACQSLLIDECQIALAGGIAVNVPHKTGYLYRPGGIFSPDGHCRAFDADAQGTVFGSGAGIVVLKRLEDALADGDTIHAVIKGSAINNDGALKASFTAPSVHSQAAVIADALSTAEVPADSIAYVEAHGTGTALGDPIEVRALTRAFQASTARKGYCAIGSVKTNLGHLDAAAGIASLIKTVLALEHGQLPPSLHFHTPNPNIDFACTPFYVNTTLLDWPAQATPRRAGVSSFGIGGTNAHIVLEEAPPAPAADPRPWQLLLLSAKTSAALESATANLARHLRQHPDLDLADVAYTLQVGRQVWNHRRMLVCRDHDDALKLLEAPDDQRVFGDPRGLGNRPVAFMFLGQGAQYVAMAAGLYDDEPVFREHVDHCAELLQPLLGLDLRDLLYPDDRPTTNDQRPTTNDDRPTTNDQRTGTIYRAPTIDDQRPTTNDQRTGTIYRAPTDDQGSTTNDQRTGTIYRAPTTINEQSTTNDDTDTIDRIPTTINERPTTNDQHTGTIYRAPTTNDAEPRDSKNQEPGTDDDVITQNSKLKTQNFAPNPPSPIPNPQSLDQTQYAQPALFVVEYALARLWMEWGVRPRALIGHSIGEYVAACLAGVFSLEDALALVAARGRMMQALPAGAMLAVPLSEQVLQPLLGRQLSLAAVNAPSLCVVSGPAEALEALERQLAAMGVTCSHLQTSHAFHSAMMDPIVDAFGARVRQVTLRPPQIPYISNVTGRWITAAEATDPGYWARHLRRTVRFADGIRELLADGGQVLLEVGPGHTLSRLVKQHPERRAEHSVIASLRHWDEEQPDRAFLLTALGKLWLNGVALDWSGIYAHERRRRLPLPTYPFERQSYWIAPGEPTGIAAGRAGKRADVGGWFYIPSWKRSMPPGRSARRDAAAQRRSWLVFAAADGPGSQLAQRLTYDDQDVVVVVQGEQFGRTSENVYMIDPRRREDYDSLFKELQALDKHPRMIVHAWSVTPDALAQPAIASFEKAQDAGCYSLIYLAQALGEQNLPDPVQIAIISNNLHSITGEEVVCPEKATVMGPCRVIPREYPNISCRSIDIVVPRQNSAQAARLIDLLAAEIETDSPDEVVAYRGGQRWVQSFEPVRLESRADPLGALRKNGVYLITGGLGGVGLVLAHYLARTVQARLILTGRTALPAREQWRRWLDEHDQQDSVSSKIRAIQAIEALGGQVMASSADVSELEQMRSVVDRGIERFGAIHGVIHAAGVVGGGLIQLKTPEIVESVMKPKVRGLLVLDALLSAMDLDFLMLFSSISAILGEFGQVDYCAANAFLDAFAHQFAARTGTMAVSINWDTWKEAGMALATAASTTVPLDLREMLRQQIAHGITSSEGTELFQRILSENSLPQIVVSTRDLQQRIAETTTFTQSHIFDVMRRNQSAQLMHARPTIETAYVAPRDETEQTIAAIWQQILGIEQIGIHDDFFDLGGHSLLAAMLGSKLRDAFLLDIPMSKIFEAPTVAQLAQIVEGSRTKQEDLEKMELLHMLAQLSEEEVETEIMKRMSLDSL